MKNKFKLFGAVVAAALLISYTASAAQVGGATLGGFPGKIVDSTLSTTNIALFPSLYPSGIAASTTVTNVILIPTAGNHIVFQFTAAAMQTNGGNVIVQFARNVQGGSLTNTLGTGLNLDLFATMTNTLPANTATTANTTCFLFGPVNGQAYIGDGAVPNFYIYSITTPANVTLTNYSVWVNVQ